jgi:hypothetical protein
MDVKSNSMKIWLNNNCPQSNNWITLYQFDNIIGHKNRKIITGCTCATEENGCVKNIDIELVNRKNLRHIYFTYMTDDIIITLVEMSDQSLWLIENRIVCEISEENENTQLPKVQTIESKIYHLCKVEDLLKCLTKKDQKLLGIKKKKWFAHIHETSKLCAIDMMTTSGSGSGFENAELENEKLKNYIKQSPFFNLSHNYCISANELDEICTKNPEITENVTEILMDQNFQINEFNWLSKFKNTKSLTISNHQGIDNTHIDQIVEKMPQLENIAIRICCRLNLKALIPIFKLSHLKKLVFDDEYFNCQKTQQELFISNDEWKGIHCPTIEKICMNSQNLTLDVIDYMLISCPNVKHLVVNENILTMISKNIVSGFDMSQPLLFSSWRINDKCLKTYRNISFKNMFKNSMDMFSESMLKKIKENESKVTII